MCKDLCTSQKKITKHNKHMKRSTTSLIFTKKYQLKSQCGIYYKPTHQNGYNLTLTITSISKDVEQLNSHTLPYIGNANWCNHWEKLSLSIEIWEMRIPYDPEIPILNYIPHRNSSTYNQKTCVIIFIVLLFILTLKQ